MVLMVSGGGGIPQGFRLIPGSAWKAPGPAQSNDRLSLSKIYAAFMFFFPVCVHVCVPHSWLSKKKN